MRVRKPDVPIEVQGKLNRMESQMENERNDMRVRDNIRKNGHFILHDVAYQALTAIIKGTEAVPGKNCVAIDLDEMIGG